MRVYLAASWSRQKEMVVVADKLRKHGIGVTSRWLYETKKPRNETKQAFLCARAMDDIEDIKLSDALVRFSDNLRAKTVPAKLATGARMFEMGLAYSLGKPVIVVGGHQCVFDYLMNVSHVKDEKALIRFIKREK